MSRPACRTGRRCGVVELCGECRLIAKDPRFGTSLARVGEAGRVPLKLACIHLGPKVDPGCNCTDRHCLKGRGVVRLAEHCQRCPDHAPKGVATTPPLVPPIRLAPVGPHGLYARPDGYSFNAGLVRHHGRLLLAYRDGWAGSNVHVAELHDDYRVHRSTRLLLAHPRATGGREDPRLFAHGGRLHVAFIGVERVGQEVRTSQLYARLGDDLSVEAVHYPELAGRQWPMEKNWSPFSHDGELLAVYETGPRHVVVRLDGDRAERVADTPVDLPWAGGVMRGGAPPVRVGDRYYHWFHGRTGPNRSPHYNVGAMAFEAKPPFRAVALSPRPMLWGSPTDNAAHPNPCYAVVAFPCGAVLEGGVWKVAMGWNDRGIRIAEWDAAAVDAALGLTPAL